MSQKISVLTTVYNCEKYIAESIESILSQTFTDFEYIIVNDGSTDDTYGIIKDLASKDSRIIMMNNEKNEGIVKSLNKALEIAKGKYIALQDGDDISFPKRLEEQFMFLENNQNYVLVGANIIVMDEYENFISEPMRPMNNQDAKFGLLFRCIFSHPSIMYSKKVIDDNNLRYDEDFIHAEDFKLITQISQYGKIFNIKNPLVKYRKHSTNNSVLNKDILINGSALIVKENMANLGLNITIEQVLRIRDLISSRGINTKSVYDDVKFLFRAIKRFQEKLNSEKNSEILYTLKRMLKWLGKKNIIFKPKYLSLYMSIQAYYYKESFFNSN
ncbi:MAG: glycosyltransferase [Bacteroidota bacterium]|nr:glycosyltransferase [Bacteroidota bacterium]